MNRHRTLALALGAGLYAAALPPLACWPLAWGALVPLLLAVRGTSPRQALGVGVAAGFLTATAVTWWLAQAISGYFAANLLLGAAATAGAYLLAVSSTFGAFALLLRGGTERLGIVARPFAVATVWVACEFVRGRVLADPWALLGYTQYRVLPLLQLASWTGVYGVSFVVVLGNATLAELFVGPGSPWARARAAALPSIIVLGLTLGGAATVWAPHESSTAPLRISVIQTNIPPAYEWDRSYAERQLRQALLLTGGALPETPDLVVWPENALSLYLAQEPLLRASLHELTRIHDFDLVAGGPRHAKGHTFNSAYLLRAGSRSLHAYDKQRLVPFAEAPPFQAAATRRSDSPRSFTAGARPGLLRGRVLFGMSICHEILYPETVHPAVARGASVLVNIANDGWLDGGYGVASRQHFAMAVFRAVEARRPLVRAATTGISGIVDPWGRIVAASTPGTPQVLSASVTPRTGLTPYVRFGDWFAVVCLAYAVAVAGMALVRGRARSERVLRLAPSDPFTYRRDGDAWGGERIERSDR